MDPKRTSSEAPPKLHRRARNGARLGLQPRWATDLLSPGRYLTLRGGVLALACAAMGMDGASEHGVDASDRVADAVMRRLLEGPLTAAQEALIVSGCGTNVRATAR